MGPPRCRAADRGPPSASPVLTEFVATRPVRSQRRCMGPQAHGRSRRRASVSVLKQMEASVLEPFLGKKPVRKPGPPRRRGPVADAGRQRHDARLVPRDRHRRPRARLLLPASSGTRRARLSSKAWNLGTGGAYAEICGRTLGRAHGRSGDAGTVSAYLGSSDALDRRWRTSPSSTPIRTEMDRAALSAAVNTGRVRAQTGLWSASASRFHSSDLDDWNPRCVRRSFLHFEFTTHAGARTPRSLESRLAAGQATVDARVRVADRVR